MGESSGVSPVLYPFRDSYTEAMNPKPEASQTLRQRQDQFDSRPFGAQLKLVTALKLVAPLKLETRVCKCGCKREWKCLESSTSQYFSNEECGPQAHRPARLEFTNPRQFTPRTQSAIRGPKLEK